MKLTTYYFKQSAYLLKSIVILALLIQYNFSLDTISLTEQIQPKVVVVTAFEKGTYSDNQYGEAQSWINHYNFDKNYEINGLNHPFFYNSKTKVGLIITDVNTMNAGVSLMALGLNQFINLKQSFIVFAGIGGGNPKITQIGDVFIAKYIIDTDTMHKFDYNGKGDFSSSFFPRACQKEASWCDKVFGKNSGDADSIIFKLNENLVDAIANHFKEMIFPELPQEFKADHSRYNITRRPKFLVGDNASGNGYYHGKKYSDFVDSYVKYLTQNKGRYATTAMEEFGALIALKRLADKNLFDMSNFISLRAVSNFDQPSKDSLAKDSLSSGKNTYKYAIQNVYIAGDQVVQYLLENK